LSGTVISVNVGRPQTVRWNGRDERTSIFKEPVPGHLRVRRLGLEGDEQADLTVHGGPEKAVYAYPSEHYAYWRTQLSLASLPWGSFGENLTLGGFLEDKVHSGDELRIGSATLAVTRPRFPCYKLGIRFGSMDMVKKFQDSGRSGFYLRVVEEGEVAAGDDVELIRENKSNPTISEVFVSQKEADD
jgi:MOSC domain-containing protein YiiM